MLDGLMKIVVETVGIECLLLEFLFSSAGDNVGAVLNS